MTDTKCILYKLPECWGLPSASPACIQAEAYLRLTNTPFEVQSCSSSSRSPLGQVPALEKGADVVGSSVDEFTSGQAIINFLQRKIENLDQHLSSSQKAELLAFAIAIESKLNPATIFTAWCESKGFAELRKAVYSRNLPFPLNYIIPWSQQREFRKRYSGLDSHKVYEEAAKLIDAIADKLRSPSGKFFFGNKPSSLDALIYGHLIFYRTSPAVAPTLQNKVNSLPGLGEYLDHISQQYFSQPAPPANRFDETSEPSSWSDAAKGQKPKTTSKVEPTKAEQEFKKWSMIWTAGAGALVASYVLFSGRYVKFVEMAQGLATEEPDDGDGEDEEVADD